MCTWKRLRKRGGGLTPTPRWCSLPSREREKGIATWPKKPQLRHISRTDLCEK